MTKIPMSPRRTSIAYLLAIPPLGWLGMHKFYLRRPLLGVAYFFTGGLFIVGWLYDLFTMGEQVARYNMKNSLVLDMQEVLESEIDELEEELEELHVELEALRAGNIDLGLLKKKIEELEHQLRTHNERA
jgi:TM2 domain-containing membrane protein YozV